jgi:uncharacterized protein (TIGR02996 family)
MPSSRVASGGLANGAALLAAVIAEPDEITHRLVYADWLLARGDPQGELIHLCETQRAATSVAPELDARIDALQAELRTQIAGDIAKLASRFTIARGFVERMTMQIGSFTKHGTRLLGIHPIRQLVLDPINPRALERLGRADALRGLRGLYLAQIIGRHGPMPLDALCASPYFDSLERLDLHNWAIVGDPEAAFARLRAPKLSSLTIEQGDCTPELLAGLARNEVVRLGSLALGDWRKDADWLKAGLAALGSPTFEQLRSLRLDLDGKVPGTLLAHARLPMLTRLHVYGAPLETIQLPTVRKLSLRSVEVGDALPELLARLPELRALWIDGGRVGVKSLEHLLALPPEHPLIAVELNESSDDSERIARLAQRFPTRFIDVD